MKNFDKPQRRRDSRIHLSPVLVIGLGRFGSAMSGELIRHGVEVMGMDANRKVVQEFASELTQAVVGDSTDPEALIQAGITEFERVVVAIGDNLEASILTASNLIDLGVEEIWAKANSASHAKILEKIGVHKVVRPEHDTGRRVAHLLGGYFQEFVELDEGFSISKMAVPKFLQGRTVDLKRLRQEHGVMLVGVRSEGLWGPAEPGTVLTKAESIIVSGSPDALEEFAHRR